MIRRHTSLSGVLVACAAAVTALAQTPPPPPGGLTAPPVPSGPELPVFQPGGGRTLTPLAIEEASMRGLLPPLPVDAQLPSKDPRNLDGAWQHNQVMISRLEWDGYGRELPFTETGKRIRDRRVNATYTDGLPYSNASAECLPPGQPWLLAMYYPFRIFQSPREISVAFEVYHSVWNIRLDRNVHDPAAARTYMGDSIGHWDGNTLVVDTVGYQRGLWLDVDGTPASRDAHLVFRIRRLAGGEPQLEITTTVNDPGLYSAPWSFVRTFAWRPDKDVLGPYNCEHQVGKSNGVGRYGLNPEPPEQQ